jgi:hypothetical protein
MTIPYSSSVNNSSSDVRVSDINGLNFNNLSTSRLIKKNDADNFGDASLETAVGAHGHSIKCYDSTGTEVSQMLFNSNGFEIAGIDNTKPLLHFGYSGSGIGQVINLNDLSFFNNTLSLRNSSLAVTLTIHPDGKIGIGSTPDYGTAGAVLTSNGSTSPVSWNRPYFMKARLLVDYNTSNSAPISLTEDDLDGNNYNFGDFSVDTWTCPKTGIYRVKTCVTAASLSPDELLQIVNQTTLYDNAGVEIRVISESTLWAGTEDSSEFDEVSVPGESIEHINIGEKVKIVKHFVLGAGTDIRILGRPDAARTYMIIERII